MPWVVTLVGTIAFISKIPPVTAQTNPPSAAQSAELEEIQQLDWQVAQLIKERKYSEAIPLAQRALAIYEKFFTREHPVVVTRLKQLEQLTLLKDTIAKRSPCAKP
jgi:hypothetical protein